MPEEALNGNDIPPWGSDFGSIDLLSRLLAAAF